MPATPTTILGLTVPSVGGDDNAWGDEINTDLGILDLLGAFPTASSSISQTLAYATAPLVFAFDTGGVGGITDTLPTAVGKYGRGFLVKKIDSGAGAITVATTGGQTIDGLSTYSLVNPGQYVLVISDNTNWQIIGNN